jgi:A/G-specific adenine glycosylase
MDNKIWVDRLSDWYLKFARVLPWRATYDPYLIWISEVMLQQTQVTTVIPYYERFIKNFPTVHDLAQAPEPEVLAAWSGLGYYSRARNLQRGAHYLVKEFNGHMPQSREQVLEIPGIGPYTAGAILSIAFDLFEPLVDGNVQRVFARFFGVYGSLTAAATQKIFWQHAERWVKQSRSPRVLNQALMELGATLCTKGTPRCDRCPLATGCYAFSKGAQDQLPPKKIRPKFIELNWVTVILESNDHLFLKQNKKGEWWADLWDFPHFDAKNIDTALKTLWQSIPEATPPIELDQKKHSVTHHKLKVSPFLFRLPKKSTNVFGKGQWVAIEEIDSIPISALARKVLSSYKTSSTLNLYGDAPSANDSHAKADGAQSTT